MPAFLLGLVPVFSAFSAWIMARPDTVAQAGSTITGSIDCAKSAALGISGDTASPVPSPACYEIGNALISSANASEPDMLEAVIPPPVISHRKENKPQVPIAH